MQIKYENIILRDMIETDIEDYVRWFTAEREWEKWDAPWEKEDTDEEIERKEWTKYYESLDSGACELYTQTWSGNVRMLRCAEKLGFTECNRCIGEREVNGRKYDGLTLKFKKQV